MRFVSWGLAWAVALATVFAARPAGIDFSAPGQFKAGWRIVTVTRPNNSTFTAWLFYPATARGSGTPFTAAGKPYPVVTFGHGFFQPVDRYQSTLEHLATWGYFAIATESESGLFPSHANMARDMRYCLDYMTSENSRAASPYFGAVDTAKYAASGHSMGGGCSILAAKDDARIRALAPLSAAETNPSAESAMLSVNIPTTLIYGGKDTIVPPSQGTRIYNNARSPRIFPVIKNGFHCGFQDVQSFGCDNQSMPRAEQLAITRSLLTSFFELHLRGSQPAWMRVWGPDLLDDAAITTVLDAGVTLTPAQSQVVATNGIAVFEVDVKNTTSKALDFDLLVLPGPWRMAIPNRTPVLNPGATWRLRASVRVPAGAGTGSSSTALLSARRTDDRATRSYVKLTAIAP
jgi:fermentation-respiration switch protein FrsA (DUF1100 family)